MANHRDNATKDLKQIAFIDCDGVLTDGSMYYSTDGDILRRFNTKDSAGILLLQSMGLTPFVISAEKSEITHRRLEKLGIEGATGVKDKLTYARGKALEKNADLKNCIHIGDDIGDLELMKEVGISYCPSDAASYIKDVSSHILKERGGEGVIRAAALHLAESRGIAIQELVRKASLSIRSK